MPTFADSSGWIAALNWRDRKHAEAVAALAELADRRERLITTDFVLDETYTVLLHEVGYGVTVRFKRDKFWSFTDCASYIVMREEALTEAFAYDDDFWQMGFTPVSRHR